MIDPTKMTQYIGTKDVSLLEEIIIFCICVAGKNAKTTAKGVDKLKNLLCEQNNFFEAIRLVDEEKLASIIKSCGLGCFRNRAKSLKSLASSGIDLLNCSIKELEAIYGIGMKTSRFFLAFTRENTKVAILDTHILKYLKNLGLEVPKSTPSKKKYLELEKKFLELASFSALSTAEFDLSIWNEFAKG